MWLFNDAMQHPNNVAGGPLNIVSNTPSNVVGASSVPYRWTNNAFGQAMHLYQSNVNVTLTGDAAYQSAQMFPTDRVTLLMIYRLTTALSSGTLVGIGAFGTDTLKAYCPLVGGAMYFDFGGASGSNRINSAALTWDLNKVYMAAFVAGNRGMSIYRDYLRVANSTTAVTRTSGGRFDLMQYSDGIEVNFVATLNAEWIPSQVMDWMSNPYAMVLPSRAWPSVSGGSFSIGRPHIHGQAVHRASLW